MFPVLWEAGNTKIYSYGFFIALGYVAAVSVSIWLGREQKIPAGRIVDLAFISLFSGIIGARALFVLTLHSFFQKNPSEIFLVWHGGLVYYGGLLTAIPVVLLYLRWQKMKVWKTLDVLAPGLVIGHAFGRIGCLGAGCCHGRACSLPWAVRLHTDLVEPSLRDIPIHPTQAYEALALLLLFCFLYFLQKKKAKAGAITLTYLFSYALIRGTIEIFRGDSIRGFAVPNLLSTSQFISILVALASLSVLAWRRLRGNR